MLSWATPVLVHSVVAATAAHSASGLALEKKQLVVACNAFTDGQPATVGIRELSHGAVKHAFGLHKLFAKSHQRAAKQREQQQLGSQMALQPPPAALASFLQLPRDSEATDSNSVRDAKVMLGARARQDRHGSDPHIAKAADELLSHGLQAQGGLVGAGGSAAIADELVVWRQQLEYGKCEEYHVDLVKRRIFLTTPDGEETCEFDPAQLDKDSGDFAQHFLVVLTRQKAASPHCAIRSVALTKPELKKNGEHSVHLATVDGFSQPEAAAPEADDELSKREARQGLKPLPPLPMEAVVRIEDKIDDEAISSETVAQRTLGWGETFNVEPGTFHVLLEDMRGAHMPDRKDVFFKPGGTYIAVRMGTLDDPMYPQHLLIQRVEDAPSLFDVYLPQL